MTREELIAALNALAADSDKEVAHIAADALLLAYVNDPEITAAFEAVGGWYS